MTAPLATTPTDQADRFFSWLRAVGVVLPSCAIKQNQPGERLRVAHTALAAAAADRDCGAVAPERLALVPVTQQHWPTLCRLRVRPEQEPFVPPPLAVLRAQTFDPANPSDVFAIELDGRPIGMFTSKPRRPNLVWFAHFLVDQSVQGRGIGRWAFQSYLNMLARAGFRGNVGLNVHRDNPAVIQFYSEQGFSFDPTNDVGEHLGMQVTLPG
ncbi:GNAT family N-acetyltransferase [Acanthopleuribacter pedis]|uniref:GNAT family N-acetyltransferase n=1 Tax=Acanthopleuribacter pedis TaxID=442870 RepID=A0A8J7Q6I1_9BACT|nr:GNAT family N-acetyltransferase [Acanthopleuribacter pedis]MBO1321427.1 GNAT family N-acetyltransferase [Acanthopleuribacter pedis]